VAVSPRGEQEAEQVYDRVLACMIRLTPGFFAFQRAAILLERLSATILAQAYFHNHKQFIFEFPPGRTNACVVA
jgi:hypothetical protein